MAIAWKIIQSYLYIPIPDHCPFLAYFSHNLPDKSLKPLKTSPISVQAVHDVQIMAGQGHCTFKTAHQNIHNTDLQFRFTTKSPYQIKAYDKANWNR